MANPNRPPERALTLWQPWAQIVARGHKLIENRPWAPPEWIIGKRIAIHAGMKWDAARFGLINSLYLATNDQSITRDECMFGAIIGTAIVLGAVTSEGEASLRLKDRRQAKWFMGPFGWVLSDVREVFPIPRRGYQKLWKVDAGLGKQIVRQEIAA